MEYKFPKIIGLVARSRSGKDTVANYIISKYEKYEFINRKLAGPIKNAVKALYGLDDTHLETDLKDIKIDKYGCSPRDIMIKITQSIMELSGTDFFTNRLYDSIVKNEITIISDVRYNHDIERIRINNGIIIKIERNSFDVIHYNNENKIDELVGDYTLVNNGTLEELYEQIDNILESYVQ